MNTFFLYRRTLRRSIFLVSAKVHPLQLNPNGAWVAFTQRHLTVVTANIARNDTEKIVFFII